MVQIGIVRHIVSSKDLEELLVMLYALDKFKSYLIGAKVIVYTDHLALEYLLEKKAATSRHSFSVVITII